MKKFLTLAMVASTSFIIVAGASAGSCASKKHSKRPFLVKSSDFKYGYPLPEFASCEAKGFGAGTSPALKWSKGPRGTKSYAIIFKDISLVNSETPQYAHHWTMWNIPANIRKLPANLPEGEKLEELGGAQQLSAGVGPRYFGPCPSWENYCSAGEVSRTNDTYSFTVYALETETIELPEELSEEENETGHNYVGQIDAYLASIAIGEAEIRATSDAAPTSAPFCDPNAEQVEE